MAVSDPGGGASIRLRRGAWHGDGERILDFPGDWKVRVHGPDAPPLGEEALRAALARPIGSPRLRELARGRRSAVVVVDDLTRPTPAHRVLPFLVEELRAGGIPEREVRILVAGGTHAPPAAEDVALKVGPAAVARHQVAVHDMRRSATVDLGELAGGTPLRVNRVLVEADLRLTVGGLYPHPAAGFSGGAKTVVPGVCAAETARHLHDALRSARERGGRLDTPMRRAIEEGARRAGVEFSVNVALGADRGITALFAGDPEAAHREGVRWVRDRYAVEGPGAAGVVIADAYPFDTDLQALADRALWPLFAARQARRRVLLAECPRGVGSHALFPVRAPARQRLRRHLRQPGPKLLARAPERLSNLVRLIRRRRVPIDVVASEALSRDALESAFPRARLHPTWEAFLDTVPAGQGPVAATVYGCAPLLLDAGGGP